jgi:ParB-like nuclease domain
MSQEGRVEESDAPHRRPGTLRRTLESVPEASEAVIMVPIERLKRGPMVRILGEDPAHVRLLASTPKPLPPILVHRSSLKVIDGMHRLWAAQLREEKTIAVRFFEGSDAEAYVAAVRANVEHGKPLTLVDRERAAERMTILHPEWSDRAIGETCALSPKTVACLRRRTTEETPHLNAATDGDEARDQVVESGQVSGTGGDFRRGRDGRVRPVDPVPGRERIAAAVRQDPLASLRQIAAQTGTSVGTVSDVRRRLAAGKSAYPDGTHRHLASVEPEGMPDLPMYEQWADDVACNSTDGGSEFARWFDSSQVKSDDCQRHVDLPPLSRIYAIVAEAQARSRIWAKYAADLESRARREASHRADQ